MDRWQERWRGWFVAAFSGHGARGGGTADRPGRSSPVRPRPRLFRALGFADPPSQIQIDGQSYFRAQIFKHDSWAATGLYVGVAGKAVCKFNRENAILGLPMRWFGCWLAHREARLLHRLSDVPNIPRPLGAVYARGALQPHAVAHAYVEGTPLVRGPLVCGQPLTDSFFSELKQVLQTMHERGVAYVDLHKCENILVGADGRPYLIDFQVSFALPSGWLGRCWPLRVVFRMLKQSDEYHLRKHQWSPDEFAMGERQFEALLQRPWWIRCHRAVAIPVRALRRRLLVALRVRRGAGYAESEVFAEEAVRLRARLATPTADAAPRAA